MKTRKPRTTGKNMDIDDTSHINGRPYNFTSIAECKIWDRMKKRINALHVVKRLVNVRV